MLAFLCKSWTLSEGKSDRTQSSVISVYFHKGSYGLAKDFRLQSQYNPKAQMKMSVFMLGDNGKFLLLPGHHDNQLQLA